MDYEIEELVPLVKTLAQKYTCLESTSITYEKARQLMEAVLYCIHEAEQNTEYPLTGHEKLPAGQMYETGVQCVREKATKALEMYNNILPNFYSYKNECLYDTFINGIPEFFRYYDYRFEPQNTILTLDYPILKDISQYSGIDKIYEFIKCIALEQRFLSLLPDDLVHRALSKYDSRYTLMIENICGITLMSLMCRLLSEKPLSAEEFEPQDYIKLQHLISAADTAVLRKQLKDSIKTMVQKNYGGDAELTEYLSGAAGDISVRLKNAADNNNLYYIV